MGSSPWKLTISPFDLTERLGRVEVGEWKESCGFARGSWCDSSSLYAFSQLTSRGQCGTAVGLLPPSPLHSRACLLIF